MYRKLFKMLAIIIISSMCLNINLDFFNGKLSASSKEHTSTTDIKVPLASNYLDNLPILIVPQTTTGVSIEVAKQYLGFKAIVNDDKLPASMNQFTKIAVSIGSTPFVVKKNGLPDNITNLADTYPNNTYASVVDKAGVYYVLVVLCDSDNLALGYYETAVNIITYPRFLVPQVPKGVEVKYSKVDNEIKAAVIKSKLPSFLNSFTKMAISIKNKPFEVEKNGLPYNISSSATFYPDNTYSSTVNKTGTRYVLVVLFDDNYKALGYYEASVEIKSVPK